jgi:hypothetical protein
MTSTPFTLALAALLAQAPSPQPAATAAPAASQPPLLHLVYRFGYNTKVASEGNGTGTTTVDLLGPAADGGMTIAGTDFWWNTVRPRATNTCEVYPNGSVTCAARPYAISPIQVTIFSLLGTNYFGGLSGGTHAKWHRKYAIKAAVIPGATGFAGNQYTWDCAMDLEGHGHPSGSKQVVVQITGTMTQEGGHYNAAKVKAGVAYDPAARLPIFVSETRSRIPQTSVYNKDLVQLQLQSSSGTMPAPQPATPAPAPKGT